MTIDEFLAHEIEAVKKFAQFYRDGIKFEPDFFPESMTAGEWHEQFLVFTE